jgi:TonB-dependent starch-binding outer membrane protein SusC
MRNFSIELMIYFIRTNIKVLLILGTLFFATVAHAQQKTVNGRVTNSKSGDPIQGVTVIRNGTESGTITNLRGEYSLSVNAEQILTFSGVGYKAQEILVGDRNVYNLQMSPAAEGPDEMVDIGYGTIKAKDATGSVNTVSFFDFNRGAITTPQELIAGKISGVQVASWGGAPGEGATIRIRGGSSIFATVNPLYIIDGIPLDNDGVSGIRNPLSIIHPSDIESVTVLKDISATAIYGSRASNGVILIKTKIAREGQPLKVNYSGYVSVGKIHESTDVLSANDFRSLVNSRFSNNEEVTRLLGNSNTDWQSEIYQPAINSDHNLSLSGNHGGVPFRIAYGFTDEKGILNTDKFSRVTMALGINPSLFEDHLKVRINLKVMLNNNRFAGRGAIADASYFDPTQPRFNDSPFNGYFTWTQPDGDPVVSAPVNPVAQLMMTEDFSRIVSSIGNIRFDYRFHNLPELRAHLNLGYDASSGAGQIERPEMYPGGFDRINGGGQFREYDQTRKNNLVDLYLNYSKGLPDQNSRLDAMLGFSRQRYGRYGKDYETNANKALVRIDSEHETENSLLSFYSRINYSIKERYFFTATVRQDGSSRFSSKNQWGAFPSLGFAWRISDEGFLQNVSTLSSLKLRLGYGLTGQQSIPYNDYLFLPGYGGQNNSRTLFTDRWHWADNTIGYDENIKWEKTSSFNVGLDFGFAAERITGAVDAYQNFTDNLISFVPATSISEPDVLLANIGSMENRGLEFSVNAIPLMAGSFTWQIGLNASYNVNEITKLYGADGTNIPGVFTGPISGETASTVQIHRVGYPANSFFVYEQLYLNSGKPLEGAYVERGSSQIIQGDDRYVYEKAAPDYLVGFSSRIKWSNLDISISGRSNFGNYIYNNVWSNGANFSHLYNPAGFLNNLSRNIYDTEFELPRFLSDYYISNASFTKIDNITLGYTIYKIFGKNSKARLYSTIQNVVTFTQYKGIDPEVINGIDYHQYPRPRKLVFGLSIDF